MKLRNVIFGLGIYALACLASGTHTYNTEIKPLESQFRNRVEELNQYYTAEIYFKENIKDPSLDNLIQQRKDASRGKALDLSTWQITAPTNIRLEANLDSFYIPLHPFGFLF